MIIAPQHTNESWRPQKQWPKDTYVQWGGSGLVFGKKSAYTTAFFEAFPPKELNASSFIRGEGTSREEAEEKAFTQFQRDISCNHVLGRRGYTNGAGRCVHCKAFFSGAFREIVELGKWRQPLSILKLQIIKDGHLLLWSGDDKSDRKYRHEVWLKARVAGIDVPPIPDLDGKDPKRDREVSEEFQKASRAAVRDFLLRDLERLEELISIKESSSMGCHKLQTKVSFVSNETEDTTGSGKW